MRPGFDKNNWPDFGTERRTRGAIGAVALGSQATGGRAGAPTRHFVHPRVCRHNRTAPNLDFVPTRRDN